jgi:hypothetical protein
MKRSGQCVGIIVMVLAVSVLAASEQLKAIVGSYLEVQAMLAADKIGGISAPAHVIATQAGMMGPGGAAILKAAKAVEEAKDLTTARAAFAPLSDAVIAAAKAEGWNDLADVKLAFCPMAKASWLQKDDKIRNPYYGKSMLECGEFKDRSK